VNGVNGFIRAGEMMAIMGASGAGKTTVLDIVSMKSKKGIVGGDILVDGAKMSKTRFTRISG